MRSSLALLLFAVACAPPPPVARGDTGVDAEPSLHIIFPTTEMLEDGIPLSSECKFNQVVAIDINNFELINPNETDGDVEGQGHWHLQITVPSGFSYAVVFDQAGLIDVEGITAGTTVSVRAALQSNTHEELTQIQNFQSVFEVTILAPEGTGGDACQ